MADAAEMESRVQSIGRGLFDALAKEGPLSSMSSLLSGRGIQRRLLSRTLEDDRFKTQLFRFVDVYPSLRDSGDLVRHLRAYLEDRGPLPAPLDRLLAFGDTKRIPSWAVARLTDRAMQRTAKGLIAGRNASEALSTLRHLRRHHTAFTLSVLGEVCVSEIESAGYVRRYSEILDLLPPKLATWSEDPLLDSSPGGPFPRLDLSIKVTSVYSQIDPLDFDGSRRAIVTALKPLFLKAMRVGAGINIDLERFAYRDLAYAVFRDLALDHELRGYPHLGTVVQSYLRDSEDDLEMLIDVAHSRAMPLTVRLVKGAYWDYETIIAAQEHWPPPVFLSKAETDAQFEKLAVRLVENQQWTRPALGTHNIRSMAAGLAAAEMAGLPFETVELQMLHGMAEPIARAAATQGYRVREYVPVGEMIPGMSYLVRRLLENTSNESFLSLAFTERRDLEQLLAPPQPAEELLQAPAPETTPGMAPAIESRGTEKPALGAIRPFQNESHADFSRPDARIEMEKALGTIQASLGREYALVIDGKMVATPTTTVSVNPARPLEVVGRVARAAQSHADQAVEAARTALPAWRDTPARDRAAALFRAAALMRRSRFELAALEITEAGKPRREADADVTEAIDFLEYYGREVLRLCRARNMADVPGETDFYFYEPRGVAAVIAPWNFPLAIPTGMVSAALAAGNTVVFKPAGPTPVIGYALVNILHEAGVPGGAINFLPGPGDEVGDYLAADPRVDLIAFTGSLNVGLSIMQRAAAVSTRQRSIKRVVAEMGGKNAIIVDTDADLDAAIDGVVISAFHFAGQKCSACSRVIVLDGVYDEFLRRLTQAAAALKIGDPADPGTRLGPVITAEARDRILAFIKKGQSEADQIYPPLSLPSAPAIFTARPAPKVTPGSKDTATETAATDRRAPVPEPGYFLLPHIFAGVPPEATIAQEEIFGPVLTVLRARRFNEALELALGVRYGLTGGLYSRNPVHIRQACSEFRVGNLYINRPITGAMVGRQPFGGSRLSGIGSKAGGPDYLIQFMEPRTVTENTVRRGFAPPPETQ